LHNTPGEKFMGKIVYTGHSFQGQTGFRTVLNRKEEILGIMKNKTIAFLGNTTLNLYSNTCFIKRDHY
jgi:hypothetical protein